MEKNDYEEFVKKYGEQAVLEGYKDFENLARDRKKAFDDLNTEKIDQDNRYAKFNKDFNTNRTFDYEGRLKFEQQKFAEREAEVVKKYNAKDAKTIRQEQFADFKKQLETEDKSVEQSQEDKQTKKQEPDLTDKQEKFAKSMENFREQQKTMEEQKSRAQELETFKAEMKGITDREKSKDL